MVRVSAFEKYLAESKGFQSRFSVWFDRQYQLLPVVALPECAERESVTSALTARLQKLKDSLVCKSSRAARGPIHQARRVQLGTALHHADSNHRVLTIDFLHELFGSRRIGQNLHHSRRRRTCLSEFFLRHQTFGFVLFRFSHVLQFDVPGFHHRQTVAVGGLQSLVQHFCVA